MSSLRSRSSWITYSVPPEYVDRELWARWDARLVRIFNQRWEQVAIHARSEPGRFQTHGEHVAAEKISGLERGAGHLLSHADFLELLRPLNRSPP